MIRALLIAALLLPGQIVMAHGDAWWIMADPSTAYCCGPQDCAPVQPGEIVRIPGGWRHVPTGTVLGDESASVYRRSIDAQAWRCIFNGTLRCLFLPTGV